MNNTTNKEDVKAITLPGYTKKEIIMFLQKAHRDYDMIDNKINKVLISDNSDIESMSGVKGNLMKQIMF